MCNVHLARCLSHTGLKAASMEFDTLDAAKLTPTGRCCSGALFVRDDHPGRTDVVQDLPSKAGRRKVEERHKTSLTSLLQLQSAAVLSRIFAAQTSLTRCLARMLQVSLPPAPGPFYPFIDVQTDTGGSSSATESKSKLRRRKPNRRLHPVSILDIGRREEITESRCDLDPPTSILHPTHHTRTDDEAVPLAT